MISTHTDKLTRNVLGQVGQLATKHCLAATHVRIHPADVDELRLDRDLYAYASESPGVDRLFGLQIIYSLDHLDGPSVEAHRDGVGALEVWDLSGVTVLRDGRVIFRRSHRDSSTMSATNEAPGGQNPDA